MICDGPSQSATRGHDLDRQLVHVPLRTTSVALATANMTAEPTDARGRRRTVADAEATTKNLSGRRWTTLDGAQRTVNPQVSCLRPACGHATDRMSRTSSCPGRY